MKNLPHGLRAVVSDHAKKAAQALERPVCVCGRVKALDLESDQALQ